MSSLLEKALALPWEPLFKAQSVERGLDYARQKRVSLQHLSPDLVRTVCRGSSLEIYTQTLQFKDPERTRNFVVGKCTCPVRNNCKHCAAALFFLQDPETLPELLANVDRQSTTLAPKPEEKPALPERIISDIEPKPRLILASFEFSAYEPRNGKMQRHIQHRAALAFGYGEFYASGMPSPGRSSDIVRHLPEETLRLRRHLDREALYRKQLQEMAFASPPARARRCPTAQGKCSNCPTTRPG